MKLDIQNKEAIVNTLNNILEVEMSGIVRYTHYSLMIIGHNRIPIVSWLQSQAQESLMHATRAGNMITHFEQHPSLKVAPLSESYKHDVSAILNESLNHEKEALALYYKLHSLAKDSSIILEEYARELIVEEETHIGEVEQMLRTCHSHSEWDCK